MNCALMRVIFELALCAMVGDRLRNVDLHFVGRAEGRDSFLSRCFFTHPLSKESWLLPSWITPYSLWKGVQDKELDMQTFLPFLGICNACREPMLYSLARHGTSFAVKGSLPLQREPCSCIGLPIPRWAGLFISGLDIRWPLLVQT